MRKRQVFKGTAFSLRVPEKVRFGIDLLCRKAGVQLSTLVIRAIEDLFEKEGLTTRKPGQLFSLLDRLWSQSHYTRARNIREMAPELLTQEEKDALESMDSYLAERKEEGETVTDKDAEDAFANFLHWAQHPEERPF